MLKFLEIFTVVIAKESANNLEEKVILFAVNSLITLGKLILKRESLLSDRVSAYSTERIACAVFYTQKDNTWRDLVNCLWRQMNLLTIPLYCTAPVSCVNKVVAP